MNTQRQFSCRFGITLEISEGDITAEPVDAIVNAANSLLMHGGGVARSIVQAGGDVIDRESHKWIQDKGPVTHQSPAYTSAGKLPCKYVIHAVGPVWGEGREVEKLASAIRGSLILAEELGVESIAFPAISTGIFGFPVDIAARIFMDEFLNYVSRQKNSHLKLIKLILYDDRTLSQFITAFDLAIDRKAGK
jgi:O-acetyl-ADP-ribose deacetylase (regulator of RNase III)